MIYRVILDGIDIYGADEGRQLIKGTADLELNGAGSCDITMPYNHESYDLPRPMVSEIDICENDTVVWFGRVTDISTNWNNEKKISAEGALAYFNDSIIRPNFWDDVYLRDFFEAIIQEHNEQVDANKQFTIGEFRVSNVKVTRTVTYSKTFDILQEQCIKAIGGYILLRKEKNELDEYVQYIDWYETIPYNCAQDVAFGVNLLDISFNLVSSDIVTAVIPLGDDGDGGKVTIEGMTTTEEGYDIVADYIYNIEATEEYGLITEIVEFNDVSNPLILVEQGLQYLKSKQFDHITFECNVAELKYLDPETDAFSLGQNVRVTSEPHFIDKILAISKISYDISSATKRVTIGTPARQDISQITGTESGGSSGNVISGGGGSGGGGGGGGGSVVTVRPIILTGDDIATITVNGRLYYLRYDASSKADADNVYTKEEMDTALALKADADDVYAKSEVYTKTETDTALALKADADEVYSKSEVYNKTETYTQAEVDQAIQDSAYVLPIATDQDLGGVMIGNSLNIDSQTGELNYILPKASANTLGGVKVGNTLVIDAQTGTLDTKTPTEITIVPAYVAGSLIATITINSTPYYLKYDLPIASDSVLGGIKVGDHLTIDGRTGVLDGVRTVYTGTTTPSRQLGETGDIYVQYEWIEDHHQEHYEAKFIRSFTKMPTGAAEETDPEYTEWVETSTGSAIMNGFSNPGDTVGKDGDVYFKCETVYPEFEDPYVIISDIYQRIDGKWTRFDAITEAQLLEETHKVKHKLMLVYNHKPLQVASTTSNTYTRILAIEQDFIMENRSPVEFDFEINMDTICDPYSVTNTGEYAIYGDTIARVIYKLNSEEFTYMPAQVLHDGKNVLSLHFAFSILEKQTHTLYIYLEVKNGSVSIPRSNFIGTITGTGLDADGFSGVMKGSDEISRYSPTMLAGISESLDIEQLVPVPNNQNDNIPILGFASLFAGFNDSLTVEADTPEEGE